MPFYATTLERAIEVFGTKDCAKRWLEKMSEHLGSSPVHLLNTQEGANQVLRHLHSVDLALHLD